MCHELNFFLYKRDREFYDQVVKDFIGNKMEKTFVDWYLLGIDLGKDSIYIKNILAYFEIESKIQRLNFIEICLLVEVSFKYGEQRHKDKARSLVLSQQMLQDYEDSNIDLNTKN